MKSVLTMAAMLLFSAGALAESSVIITKLANGNTPASDPGTVSSEVSNGTCTLTVTPAEAYYVTGSNIQAFATVTGDVAQARQNAPQLDNAEITVTATDATADPSGVTTYTFTMPTDESNVEVTVDFQGRTTLTEDMVVLSATSFTYNGSVQKPTVTVTGLTAGTDYIVTNEGGTDVDTYSLTVTGKGVYTGEVVKTFTITAMSLAGATVEVDATQAYIYSGDSIKPGVTVTLSPTTLQLNTDYTVSYQNNVNAAAASGTTSPTVTVTGRGNYAGTAFATFTIAQADFSSVVIAEIDDQTYTGEAIEPGVTVTFNDKAVSGEEYTVGYSSNTEAGEATVTLTSTGKNFTAGTTKSATFQIIAATATLSGSDQTVTYNGAAQSYTQGSATAGTLVVTYYVTEADRSKGSNGTTDAPTAAGTYYVRLSQGDANYTSAPVDVTFTIAPAAITSVTLSETTLTYTGAEQTVSVSSVKAGELTLTASDYTLSGNIATTPGTYTVTVTAVADGNFSGSATADFTVSAKSIAGVTIPDIAAQDYTGSAVEPAVTVTDGSTPLVLDTDYTVSYSNNVNAGEATVTITGKGNYDSATTATKHFTISPVSLEGVTIAAIADQAYTGEAVEPAVSVTFNGKAVSGEEYTVGYSSNTEAGEATVTLTSTGKNFTAGTTKSATFQIIAATATLSGSDQTVTYNGAAQSYTQGSATAGTLVVTYYVTEADRSKGSNGTTDAPTAAGTYYVRLSQGDANYSSAPVDVTFTIVPAAITSVTLSETTLTYTGTEQTVSVSSVKAGDLTLTASDYTLSGNTATDAGTYTVTVTATTDGNFTGSSTAEFNIVQASFADVEIAAIADQAYTGSAIEPAVTVTFNDNAVASDDYTVSYSNNTNAGEALVTLTSTGKNFTEGTTKSTTFQIVAVTATITGTDQSVTYDGQSHAYTNGSISEGTLVITYYSSASDRSEETGGTTEAPTNAGTYFVRLSQGDANFASVPVDVTFTIAQAAITSVTLAETSLTYTGAEQTVAVSEVKAGDLVLTATDYIVSGNTATDAGTYTVTVTAVANGNFTGEATASFTIINRTISQDEIAFAEGQTFASYYSTTEDLELPEGLVAYIVTGVTATTVTTQAVSYIPKNVPVLVEKTASSVETVDVVEGNLLHGTTAPTAVTSITEGTVYVLYNNEFVKSVSGIIPANRCYLVLDNQTAGSRLRIVGSHDASGIQLSTSIEDESAVWYDQNGRMLNGKPVKKGLYLQKGKKILVK
ncbi:MAG: hypothetical protein IJ570_09015 [Prevotella sp.]|nr:hypothetical protein [Prevotella sp.]